MMKLQDTPILKDIQGGGGMHWLLYESFGSGEL